MRLGEEDSVCRLIEECFNKFIAPEYTETGVREFLNYVNPQFLNHRVQRNHIVLVALNGDQLIGAIELRSYNHISLLFVKTEYQNMGIAKKLLNLSLELCKRANPSLAHIDVNSSPNAVRIYEKLGFTQTDIEQEVNGIRFTPMKLSIE
jgi:ribosomal protein S18 acetylase RimI-like enzyme